MEVLFILALQMNVEVLVKVGLYLKLGALDTVTLKRKWGP